MRLNERNQKIREERLAGATLVDLQRRYGLSHQTIWKITKDLPTTKKGGPPRMKPFDQRRPLSDLHQQIGLAVANHRVGKLDMGRIEFGILIGLSAIKVAELEQGLLDLPLTLLAKLAALLDKDVHELLRPKGE